MKKSFFLILALSVMSVSLFTACKKNSQQEPIFQSSSPQMLKYKERKVVEATMDSNNKISFDSLKNFFTLDYTPEYPDSLFVEEETKTSAKTSASKSEKSESVIPGVRKLSDYVTKYITQKPKLQEYKPNSTLEEEDDSTKEFFIEDWGPQSIVGTEEHPSFYVVFSRPVKSLKALDVPQTTSDIMTITPAISGVFRWYGTKHLSFEADGPIDPTVTYTISIKSDLKSSGGKKLTGDTVFQTTADPIEVTNIWGGYIKNSDCAYNWSTGALPPYEGRFVIRTNYSASLDSVKQNLSVTANNEPVNYKITPIYENIFKMWSNYAIYDEDAGRTNTFLVEIENVKHNAIILVKTNGSKRSKNYNTLKAFQIDSVPALTEYSSTKMKWPLVVKFTQVPDLQSLIENTSFDVDYKLTKDNFSINGTTVRIGNLPFNYNQKHTVTFGENLKDKYGQTISAGAGKYNFSTPKEMAFVHFQNYGTTMLEAQFPHKMIFEHQNLDSGNFTLQKTDRPLSDGIYVYNTSENVTQQIDLGSKNQRNFQEIELDPFLTNGYGFVRFNAKATYTYYDYWDEDYDQRTSETEGVVQVTDLGITARLSINKAVVMVRSLSTGKPVENAKVYIVNNLNDTQDYDWKTGKRTDKKIFVYGKEDTYSNLFAEGKTDKNGLAVIEYTEEQIAKIETGTVDVYVVNGDDKAAFAPSSHNSWRNGVRTGSIREARTAVKRTFMFVDRGLYKPGETVTFRGIDRDQLMGSFTPHKGSYTISVKGSWWDAPKIIDDFSGSLSESGGFYGSFKLPDNLERGYYNLIYTRNDSNESERITFTVADFERVKFESSISIPEITYYGGDKLSATLSADYLAGGSLSGADYTNSWYKSATTFSTSQPEAKNYSFYTGISPDRIYYSNGKGVLGTDGTANLTCTSEKITDGAPYIYHVESTVTDLSNQRIAAQNDVFVHPALFYVGLAKPLNVNGFAKAKQKIDIPYIIVNTDGTITSDSDVALKVSNLEYKLTREVWSMVHEQSVDDTIYARYERSDVEEDKGEIKAASKGNISFTPQNAGWYTLTVTGKDNRGNKVLCIREFYVTGSGASWYDQYNSNSINLTPDQSQYNPGETANILLESPLPAGDYLITVEREGIFTEEIRHFDESANVIEVPIAGNYVPVVYVSVSSYSDRHGAPTHNYGEPDLDKPKGYYGVTPVFINPYVRSFSVKIECDKPSYKPGENVTIKFTATKGGQPYAGAELTAMAVDRGVLDLINYHVPNPIEYFYNRNNFPLRVYGGDSRSLLMDPVTYSVKDLKGGDSTDEEKEDERKDFRPTAFFEPALITDKNGEATVTFKMPDSLTTYRITAFGVKDDVFALQEEEVKVQNPINIQQVQPRRLRERDTAECGVLITNLGKDGQKVTVGLEVLSPTEDTEQDKLEGRKTIPGKGFVDGANSHTVYVASGQSTVVYFDVGATQQGTINLVYSIKSDVLNERLISPIRVEKTFVYETVTMTGTVSDKGKGSEKESIIIPGMAKEGRGDLTFTLDATRLGALGGSVNYLFDYPYGCLEQQSSRILPLVCFDEYIDIFGLDSQISNIKECVKSFTANWKDYQHSDGGFGYWPDSIYSNFWVSSRVAYIYALALQRGYTEKDIPINIESLKKYLKSEIEDIRKKITVETNYYDYTFAFNCYVFSLLNDSSLNSLRDSLYADAIKDNLTLDAAAYLSLAYSNTGKADDLEKAKNINKKIRGYLQPSQRSVTLSPKAKSGYWFWYQSETVQYAAILSAFAFVNPDAEMVDRLIYTLLEKQSKGYWQNTITTSAVLESIYTYIKKRNLDETNYTATAKFNGKTIMNEKFSGVAAKPKTLKLPFEDEFVSSLQKDKAIPLEFEKDGDGYLFYTVEMKYAIPDEAQAARDEGLKITYEITDYETGKLINVDKDTCDLTLESGKLYKAKVYIQTNRTREYVAVRAPIPSGAEIMDSTFVTTGSGMETNSTRTWSWYSRMSHKNITDNEIQFFWDEMHSGKYSFDFTFRAVRRGIYPTPPVQAECMYEPEIFGRSDGYLFIIE